MKINSECISCGMCVEVCEHEAIDIVKSCGHHMQYCIDDKKCVNCGKCKAECTNGAIEE
jgi:ferredoxin